MKRRHERVIKCKEVTKKFIFQTCCLDDIKTNKWRERDCEDNCHICVLHAFLNTPTAYGCSVT